jgi:hypothetical protein
MASDELPEDPQQHLETLLARSHRIRAQANELDAEITRVTTVIAQNAANNESLVIRPAVGQMAPVRGGEAAGDVNETLEMAHEEMEADRRDCGQRGGANEITPAPERRSRIDFPIG